MTPHFKLLNSILCLTIAMHCQAEDYASVNSAPTSAENALVEIATVLENKEAKRHLNLGFQQCLLQYPEKARQHFSKALAEDDTCLLAHVGMMMVSPAGSDTYKLHLKKLNEGIDQAFLTPAEEWYLSTFLQYIAGDLKGAAAAFRERAALYRRDSMAACWDIILGHYAAAEQGDTLIRRADSLLKTQPDNALFCYARALLEEYAAKPSENALKAAKKAVSMLPDSAPAYLLHGCLQGRSGKHSEAVSSFNAALNFSMDDLEHQPLSEASVYRTAALSEICAYWQSGQKIDALKRCLALTREIPAAANTGGEGDILLHWEARTLPLRLLVLQPTAPSGAAINAASKSCNAPEGTPLHYVQSCLKAAIQTRSLADSGRMTAASQTLQKAEQALAQLEQEDFEMSRHGGITLTCYKRATRACKAALYRAKLSLYPDSKDIWKPYLDELLAQPDTRLLPPVLPQLPPS